MTDEQQKFLDYIEQSPMDEERRLVYSDWLEEQGLLEESERQRKYIPAKKWLENFAWEGEVTYEEIIEAAMKTYENNYNHSAVGEDNGYHLERMWHELGISDKFWECFEIVTDLKVSQETIDYGYVFTCCR